MNHDNRRNNLNNENAVNPIGRAFLTTFGTNDLHGIEYDGEPCVLAFEQADAIEADRRAFSNHINAQLGAGEMEEGKHVIFVKDPAMVGLIRKAQGVVTNSMTTPIHESTPNVTLLTRHGAIRAAMTSRAPKAKEFRDWAEEVLFNVLTTGKHEEAPKDPPPSLRDVTNVLAELRRNKMPQEAIQAVAGALFARLGIPLTFTTPKPPEPAARAIPTAPAVPFEALRTWATGREPFTTQDALVGVLGVPEASIRQPAVQWFNAALREIGARNVRVRGQRRRWVLGV